MPLYNATFTKGARVQVAILSILEEFQRGWVFHNPLQPAQLEYANRISVVESIGYYHGGDVIYKLEGLPGVWHERCLGSVPIESSEP